jgi:putative spermidine/putrescine transport system ATP-binding protein
VKDDMIPNRMAETRPSPRAEVAGDDLAPQVDERSAHLVLERLSKSYGSAQVVASLDLSVRQGEFIALLGPSGCGKSTTLRMTAGLTSATSGRIVIGGRDVTRLPAYRRDIGLVFQNYALFPHMTVAENVAFGLEMRKVAKAEAAERVREALELVRLAPYGERRPRELSGGQQQRVALARALVIRPSILLLDEPLSNLDAKLRDEMRSEIREIQQRLGITALFVTHDQVEALSMCDRVAVMHGGALVQVGTPFEIYERPTHPFVAEFVGRTNRLSGVVRQPGIVAVGTEQLRASSTPTPGAAVTVMVRPHRIELSRRGAPSGSETVNRVFGTIARITYLGEMFQYEVETSIGLLQLERPTTAALQPFGVSDAVELSWIPADTLVFGDMR